MRPLAVFTMLAALIPALPCYAVALLGNTYGGDGNALIYTIDSGSGLASQPRPTGLSHLAGVTMGPSGFLYGLTTAASIDHPASLFSIDPTTGHSQLIGPTGLTSISEGDIAFDWTTGQLYGAYQVNATQRQLFTIDAATGATVATIGGLPGDPSALAFDGQGQLYVLDTSLERILQVDKATGSVIANVALSLSLGSTAGMAIDPDSGTIYVADGEDGSTNKLYMLNAETGYLSAIGSTGLARGIAGLTVPEPGTLVLVVLLGATLLRKR